MVAYADPKPQRERQSRSPELVLRVFQMFIIILY